MISYKKIFLLTLLFIFHTSTWAQMYSEGWFYRAYYLDMPDTTFLVGAFGSKQSCDDARAADFASTADNRLPDPGSSKCSYIYENELILADQIYNINQPYKPVIDAERNFSEIKQFLDEVKALEQIHQISAFRADLRRLIERTVNQ